MERSARDDEAALANGLDPCALGPGQLTALMRLLHDSAVEAKRAKRIDPLIHCLYRHQNVNAAGWKEKMYFLESSDHQLAC